MPELASKVKVESSSKGAVSGALRELYDRRWLALYFLRRQLSQSHKNSYLGFAWVFISPLVMIAIYTVIFSEIVGLRFRETDGVLNFGIYLYCGLLPFLAFSSTATGSVNTIRSNAPLVQKVVFPLEILPLATAASAVINQIFGFAILILVVLVLQGLSWTMLLIPLILVPQLLFCLGVGFLGTVVGAYLPDVRETLTAVVRAMLFATPIIWPPELAYEQGLWFVVDLNPLAIIVEGYRNVILDGTVPGMLPIVLLTLFSGALCVAAFALFVRVKRRFADLI